MLLLSLANTFKAQNMLGTQSEYSTKLLGGNKKGGGRIWKSMWQGQYGWSWHFLMMTMTPNYVKIRNKNMHKDDWKCKTTKII